MGIPSTNIFTSYTLSDDEVSAAFDLSILSIQALQNIRSNVAIQRLNLSVDSKDQNSFLQQEAYLKGQMDVITHILDSVEVTAQAKLAKSQQ